jgi:hypothetical protein
MSSPLRKILDEVQKLPKQDRALLRAELDQLDEAVPQHEVDHAWDEEIAGRLRSLKDGTAVLHDWDDVEREADRIVED